MPLTKQEQELFRRCVDPVLRDGAVQSMEQYLQHGSVTCLSHCLAVADVSFRWYCRLHLSGDVQSLVEGALLHDFFLYDWHQKGDRKGLHGFTHPRAAWENASRRFPLTPREKDIILRHMWPLTPVPPHTREGLLVCLADKYCALRETLFQRGKKRR
ncbi:MAG: phosphohydrolase [Oscillospiraceae bacterium]|nr:phosphohydrolase [Oscillospiraceae bacterium]